MGLVGKTDIPRAGEKMRSLQLPESTPQVNQQSCHLDDLFLQVWSWVCRPLNLYSLKLYGTANVNRTLVWFLDPSLCFKSRHAREFL